MNCRMNITGQKTWVDNNNAAGKRPAHIEIVLYRNDVEYDKRIISSTGSGKFSFLCLVIKKNDGTSYDYRIDERDVPAGYTKKIEGFNITNTLI